MYEQATHYSVRIWLQWIRAPLNAAAPLSPMLFPETLNEWDNKIIEDLK